MTYSARILADSVPENMPHARLTTMELVFPRIVLAEFNTHRVFSRNSASSRAIPVSKQIEKVLKDPYVPQFKHNQKGMQPADPLTPIEDDKAVRTWLEARNRAVEQCSWLDAQNVHKQWCNRLLEPFMWHTVIVTANREQLI